MSEQPAETPPGGGGKKILGMRPRTFYIMMGAAIIGGLGYAWYKNYKAGKAAAAAPPATTASGTGNTDYSGALSTLQTELESVLAGQGGTTATGTTTTTTGTGTGTSGPAVVMSLPDGSGGWEQVSFPDQAAVDAWTAWNQGFFNNNRAQATRSQWNSELTSLGVKRTDGQPLAPPSTKTGNPYDAR